jgi:hypothetical protein
MSIASRLLRFAVTLAGLSLTPRLAGADEPAPVPADVKLLDASTDATAVLGETVESTPAVTSSVAPIAGPDAPAPAPAPYVLPWRLRPAAVLTAVRADTVWASYRGSAPGRLPGRTLVSMFAASYKLTGEFAPFVRVGVLHADLPGGDSAIVVSNIALGGHYVRKVCSDVRLTLTLGAVLPVGSAGGNSPNGVDGRAMRAGPPARSAMDNALFGSNDLSLFPGMGLAYVAHGFTVQAEATVIQAWRVQGERAQLDVAKTNFTTGLFAGYFVVPQLSVGLELDYQRFLSTPTAVRAAPPTRDSLTAGGGIRAHLKLGDWAWLRPGISYSRGLDQPTHGAGSNYSVIQVDVPLILM